MILQPHNTWDILDSSKLQAYQTCPRKFFYRYILGWDVDMPNHHLIYGQAWHAAMEYILVHGKSSDAATEAHGKFMEVYTEHYPIDLDTWTDIDKAPKDHANALIALHQYVNSYKDDDFDVLYTEVSGSVPFASDCSTQLYYRLDGVVRNSLGVHLMEHKTTGRLSQAWINQWSLSIQISLYMHALMCVYNLGDIYGAIVNAVAFQKKENKLMRVIVRRVPETMEAWYWEMGEILRKIAIDMAYLMTDRVGEPIMQCFTRHTTNCTKFNQCCTYMDFCTMWGNPLAHLDIQDGIAVPPSDLVTKWWDPTAVH